MYLDTDSSRFEAMLHAGVLDTCSEAIGFVDYCMWGNINSRWWSRRP